MRLAIVCLCALLAGCAGNDCARSPFELGQRDGMLGANQTERLAASCGGSFDAARYVEGYRETFSRRPPPVGD
jgi:hypothetical protein